MAYKDLHNQPFDEGTLLKLEIFENYTQAWLPTFIMPGNQEIHIFDFFAGTGYDKMGVAGSAIRILKKIKEQEKNLFQKNVRVVTHFNEFEPNKRKQDKFIHLRDACQKFSQQDEGLANILKVELYNEDFAVLFPKMLKIIKQYPSLVFLDQNGIKFLSDKYFLELEKCNKTDFLYFVSSSHLRRFGEEASFKNHLNLDLKRLKSQSYKYVHRELVVALRKKLPRNSKLKLYPFSIKKGATIHGIIFGASHPRAVDKFLALVWKQNALNGEANYDIDNDSKKGQLDLFEGKKKTKIEQFEEDLEARLLSGQIQTNADVLEFCYENGHIPAHGAKCVKELKKKGILSYEGKSPLVTYDNVFKKSRILKYQIIHSS